MGRLANSIISFGSFFAFLKRKKLFINLAVAIPSSQDELSEKTRNVYVVDNEMIR